MKLPFGLKLAILFGLKPTYEVREYQGSQKQTVGKLVKRTEDLELAKAAFARRRYEGASVDLILTVKLDSVTGDKSPKSKGPQPPPPGESVGISNPHVE